MCSCVFVTSIIASVLTHSIKILDVQPATHTVDSAIQSVSTAPRKFPSAASHHLLLLPESPRLERAGCAATGDITSVRPFFAAYVLLGFFFLRYLGIPPALAK